MQVCGEGEGVIGDAVVPLRSMFLDGADNIEVPGAFHSMSSVGTYDSPGGTSDAPVSEEITLAWQGARSTEPLAELSMLVQSLCCMTGHVPALLCPSLSNAREQPP